MTMKKAKKKVITNPKTGRKKTVRYGQKGANVDPGSKRADAYCSRSWGQMRDYPSAARNKNSALRLSRARWKCSGKKSRRK